MKTILFMAFILCLFLPLVNLQAASMPATSNTTIPVGPPAVVAAWEKYLAELIKNNPDTTHTLQRVYVSGNSGNPIFEFYYTIKNAEIIGGRRVIFFLDGSIAQ